MHTWSSRRPSPCLWCATLVRGGLSRSDGVLQKESAIPPARLSDTSPDERARVGVLPNAAITAGADPPQDPHRARRLCRRLCHALTTGAAPTKAPRTAGGPPPHRHSRRAPRQPRLCVDAARCSRRQRAARNGESETAVDRPALQMAVDEPGIEAVAGADRVDGGDAQSGGAHDSLAVERERRPARRTSRRAAAPASASVSSTRSRSAPATGSVPRLAATASASSRFGK